MKHKIFKPFDKVLVRDLNNSKWHCAIYSHFDEPHHYTSYPYPKKDEYILPYEGNEHLISTTDEPEEEITLEQGEWILVSSFYDRLSEGIGVTRKYYKTGDNVIYTKDVDDEIYHFGFCIPFKYFSPNNMKEIKKRILCVKNGKIVRYKE